MTSHQHTGTAVLDQPELEPDLAQLHTLVEQGPEQTPASSPTESEPTGATPQAVLGQALSGVERVIPPLWPLKDYVAVNPFAELADKSFLEVHQMLRDVRDCQLLMPIDYYKSLLEGGQLTEADLEVGLEQCKQAHQQADQLTPRRILTWLTHDASQTLKLKNGTHYWQADPKPRYRTVAAAIDAVEKTNWTETIVAELSRHCAAHYDQGQAAWPSPWKDQPLYDAYRKAAGHSRRMAKLKLPRFSGFMQSLPSDPRDAIADLLDALGVPQNAWQPFLLAQLLSIPGWASYVRYLVREDAMNDKTNDDLVGLLALRLACDVALLQAQGSESAQSLGLYPTDGSSASTQMPAPPTPVLMRYALQLAAEHAWRRQLCQSLKSSGNEATATPSTQRKAAQMAFCIDVRSEVLRRHLEAVSPEIETLGFAGFFGVPMSFTPLGEADAATQCPVLLKPSLHIHETLPDPTQTEQAIKHRQDQRGLRKLWKSFQTSACSCFSFVESVGLAYYVKLASDAMHLTRPISSPQNDGVSHQHRGQLKAALPDHAHWPLEQKVELAQGILKNLGLTAPYARVVALCGHGSEVANNPYKSGLDCGACAGHSGHHNARIAATLLNDPAVRAGLADTEQAIPDDTLFVAGLHNTTTDALTFVDAESIPASHQPDLIRLQQWTSDAGALTRLERIERMSSEQADDVYRRSRDWSELRPEWGLAGNAAFIVAPRSRTQGVDLGGRAFLHNYDHSKDPQLKILELIMTAPMVVTSWINLQYYASTVDNEAFGSGNKAIHNVTSQLGIIEGNAGDLKTGLPWQSLHDGQDYQHKPLRLQVFIDAPRQAIESILDKHESVRGLATNQWVTVIAMEGERCYQWAANETWQEVAAA